VPFRPERDIGPPRVLLPSGECASRQESGSCQNSVPIAERRWPVRFADDADSAHTRRGHPLKARQLLLSLLLQHLGLPPLPARE
jgi:hypothetical protein